ncbi:hypothetical protein [Leptospira santarosai]|uniref:hypothetical protein n=1 Tax=Leptospira santarosai TaxID=28183 RepID=UPI0012D8EE60|nr:hypothetical protein [Leptospira santarosai]
MSFLLLRQKDQLRKLSETLPKLSISLPKDRSIGRVWKLSETLPKLSISLPKGRSIGRVWKLSETLPKLSISLPKGRSIGRVSGFVPDAATLGSSVIEFLLGQVLIFFLWFRTFFPKRISVGFFTGGWFWDTLKNPTMDFRL